MQDASIRWDRSVIHKLRYRLSSSYRRTEKDIPVRTFNFKTNQRDEFSEAEKFKVAFKPAPNLLFWMFFPSQWNEFYQKLSIENFVARIYSILLIWTFSVSCYRKFFVTKTQLGDIFKSLKNAVSPWISIQAPTFFSRLKLKSFCFAFCDVFWIIIGRIARALVMGLEQLDRWAVVTRQFQASVDNWWNQLKRVERN